MVCGQRCGKQLQRGGEFFYLAGMPKGRRDVEHARHRRLDRWRLEQRQARVEIEGRREISRLIKAERRQRRAAAKAAAVARREAREERQIEEDQAREREARIRWLVNFLGDIMDQLEILADGSAEANGILALVADVVSDVIDDELDVALARLMPQSAG
jgi:hypothetical protein